MEATWVSAVEWVTRAVGLAREYWVWLTGLGVVTSVSVAAKWVRESMVNRTARKIFRHMEKETEAKYLRVHGSAGRILEHGFGKNISRVASHPCSPACVKSSRVLGPFDWFIESAFKRLLKDEPRVTFQGRFYYIKGTEPEG